MIEEGEGWGGARQCGRGSGNGRWVKELTAGGAQQVGAAAGASCALGGSVPAAEGARRGCNDNGVLERKNACDGEEMKAGNDLYISHKSYVRV